MNTTKIVVALISIFFLGSATAAQPPKAERPIDAADLAAFERILETLENGGKVCLNEFWGTAWASHLRRRPCMQGSDLKPEEWATLYENLRKLKVCAASSTPCMPKKKEKEKAPPGKVKVYNAQ